ncbi:MAG: hypothetical protein J6A03_03745 [Lachnospiraceae bacterium]|nr:hypothetical protein [Lachnospiraceae bacterium]
MKKTNETVKKNQIEWHIIILMSILIGFTAFVCLYGISSLNVCNDEWLKGGTDLTQHYLGWVFYRNSDWMFPIGMHNQIAYPEGMSVVYTDSIPLFAVFFKLFSPILPSTFQYLGLFVLFCFILQVFFSILLVKRATDSKLVWGITGVLFIFMPVMLTRAFGHTALTAHFLILMTFCLWSYRKELKFIQEMLLWALLGFLCVGIQIYFVPMVGLIAAARILEDLLSKQWKVLLHMLALVMSVFLTAYMLGTFEDGVSGGAWGLGYFNANLNALFDSRGVSCFLKELPVLPGQYEGNAYLGIGGLILVIVAFIYFVKNRIDKTNMNVKRVIACTVLVIVTYGVAMSYKIAWNDHILVNISIPDFLYKLLSVFRTSGRFVWVIVYGLMIYSVYQVIRNSKKYAVYILIACTVLQIIDIGWYFKKDFSAVYENNVVISDEWEEISDHYSHIVLVDGLDYSVNTVNRNTMFEFAWYAAKHDMTINIMYCARPLTEIHQRQLAEVGYELSNGTGDKDTLYIFSGDYIWDKVYPDLNLYQIDGIVVGSYQKEELDTCIPEANYIKLDPNGENSYCMDLEYGLYKIVIHGENLSNIIYQFTNGLETLELERTDSELSFLFSSNMAMKDVEIIIGEESDNITNNNCLLYKEQ